MASYRNIQHLDDDNDDDDDDLNVPTRPTQPLVQIKSQITFPSCRVVLAWLAFLGFVNVYALRVNLSVALVAMVNTTDSRDRGDNMSECPGRNTSSGDVIQTGEFDWSPSLQGMVLGAFFYGYITTQLVGGWLAQRIGAKWLYGGGVLCTSVLTLLTPLAARSRVELLLALRVLEGIGEGVTFPAMHAMLSQWAPPLERSKLGTFIYSGAQMGTVIAMPVSGLLCKYGFAGGWPSVFYVFGTTGCVWFVLWCVLCYDSPDKHPRISQEERHYIKSALAASTSRSTHGPPPTPWCSILTSIPVWSIVVAHFTFNWGNYTLLMCLPLYMKNVLGLNISQNGLLSGLPYLFCWMTMVLGGQAADTLRSRKLMSTTNVRKMMNSAGQLFPALFLVITSYLGCDTAMAVTMVTIAVGLSGLGMAGYNINHLDIAPQHAGTLLGLTNTFATIPGFVGPQVVGKLTEHNSSRGQWQIVFFITAAIYVFGTIVFLAFSSGEEQAWANTTTSPGEPGEGEPEGDRLLESSSEE